MSQNGNNKFCNRFTKRERNGNDKCVIIINKYQNCKYKREAKEEVDKAEESRDSKDFLSNDRRLIPSKCWICEKKNCQCGKYSMLGEVIVKTEKIGQVECCSKNEWQEEKVE